MSIIGIKGEGLDSPNEVAPKAKAKHSLRFMPALYHSPVALQGLAKLWTPGFFSGRNDEPSLDPTIYFGICRHPCRSVAALRRSARGVKVWIFVSALHVIRCANCS